MLPAAEYERLRSQQSRLQRLYRDTVGEARSAGCGDYHWLSSRRHIRRHLHVDLAGTHEIDERRLAPDRYRRAAKGRGRLIAGEVGTGPGLGHCRREIHTVNLHPGSRSYHWKGAI